MGDVSTAVTERQEPKQLSPRQVIKQQLDTYKPVIRKLLAETGMNEETFTAQIANACRVQPKLLGCTPETVLGAALRAAQLGLTPNDTRNMCWIIPYGKEASFQLGYGGVMELARRAVPGLVFDGRPVHPNDEFDVDYGAAQPLKHRPALVLGLDRGGDAFAWYVRAVYPDGTIQIHMLDREGVEYHRQFSKNKSSGMWKDNYDAAALKSVVLDMKRWLPSSSQMVAAFASDEQTIDVREVEDIGELDYEPVVDEDDPDDTEAE